MTDSNGSGVKGAARPDHSGASPSALRSSRPPAMFVHVTWLMFLLAVLLMVRYFVPPAAREIAYAITQGRQRAETEFATVALQNSPLEELSNAFHLVSQRVGPSVVHINITGISEETVEHTLLPFFSPRYRESQGQGSGVIVHQGGYIMTNQHVVDGGGQILVSLSDGRRVMAEVVGVDALTDLALIKINADNLVPAEWGDSDKLRVGSLVWAVGSPFGLEQSVTSGIVSAKNRSGKAGSAHQDFLQTDAAVNPGNSGGPLVDARGRIVGINTAIFGESYRGISFAIPSNVARHVFDRLKEDGEVARGWLGVQLYDLDEEIAEQLGISIRSGAYIHDFVEEQNAVSPARRAGLQIGDVVVQWGEHPVGNRASLSRLVAQTPIGSEVPVVVQRHQEQVTMNVILGRRPPQYNH